MNKANKTLMQQLYLDAMKRAHPKFPEFAIPPYKGNDNSANGLTQVILDFFEYNGWQAERITSSGRWLPDKKIWIKSTSTAGTADISATLPVIVNGKKIGLSLKIEVKFGKDRQSMQQVAYQNKIERGGGVYLIARDFDRFLSDLNEIKKSYGIY